MKDDTKEIKPIDEETQFLIDQFYSIPPLKLKFPDGTLEEVNPDGNIGLFAFGYKGIIAWRKKREELYGEKIYSPLIAFLNTLIEKKKQEENGSSKI